MLHYEPKAADCPWYSPDYSITTDELADVDCLWCAEPEPEPEPDYTDEPAYGAGYAHGKDKAHFEVRMLVQGPPHHPACGCEPCKTIRAVLAAAPSWTRAQGSQGNRLVWDGRQHVAE